MEIIQIIINEHDKFFRESFARKEIAESFIETYLPAPICKHLDMATLEILKDSYVDKELSEHFSDILYRVKLSGKLSYMYLLFEHKSYIDSWVSFQLLRNMVKIWEGFLKQHKNVKHLPIIIPIVVYHGKKKWDSSHSIVSLFDPLKEARCYIPDFKAEVFDISHLPDDQIKGQILLRVHLLILKYIFSPALIGKLHEILNILNMLADKEKATEYLEIVLRYLVAAVDTQQESELKKEIENTLHDGGAFMPTIAEKWLREGIERKAIEAAEKMIEKEMSNADIRDITGLSIKKIEELRQKHKKK